MAFSNHLLITFFLIILTMSLSATSSALSTSSKSTNLTSFPESDISSTKSTRTNLRCTSNGDCPTNAVCYQSKCVCRYGFIWLEPVQLCSPLLCPVDLVCKVLPNSRCLDGSCVCIDGYKVDEESQLCVEDKLSTAAIVGIAIAGVAVVIVIAVVVVTVICCCRK